MLCKVCHLADTRTERRNRGIYRNMFSFTSIISISLEQFDDYRKVGELTLPHGYTLDFSISHLGTSVSGGGFAAKWTIKALEWNSNTSDINQQFFNTKK